MNENLHAFERGPSRVRMRQERVRFAYGTRLHYTLCLTATVVVTSNHLDISYVGSNWYSREQKALTKVLYYTVAVVVQYCCGAYSVLLRCEFGTVVVRLGLHVWYSTDQMQGIKLTRFKRVCFPR